MTYADFTQEIENLLLERQTSELQQWRAINEKLVSLSVRHPEFFERWNKAQTIQRHHGKLAKTFGY